VLWELWVGRRRLAGQPTFCPKLVNGGALEGVQQ